MISHDNIIFESRSAMQVRREKEGGRRPVWCCVVLCGAVWCDTDPPSLLLSLSFMLAAYLQAHRQAREHVRHYFGKTGVASKLGEDKGIRALSTSITFKWFSTSIKFKWWH